LALGLSVQRDRVVDFAAHFLDNALCHGFLHSELNNALTSVLWPTYYLLRRMAVATHALDSEMLSVFREYRAKFCELAHLEAADLE
jgi:hypothetical protein